MYKVLSGLDGTVWHKPTGLPYGAKILYHSKDMAPFCLIKWEV